VPHGGQTGSLSQDSPDPGGDEEPRPPLLRLATVFYGVLLAVAVLWSWGTGRSLLFADAEAARTGLDPWRDAGVGLLAGLIVVLLSREFTRRTRTGEALARAFGALLGPLSWADCLVLAVLSGVAEEVFFRGALQPLVGLVPATLIFGLVHFVPRRELLPWTGFALAAGLLLGILFEATGNLLAPVLTHVTVNALNLRFLSLHHARDGRV
jgi:membrane protease YdiL (CAAX protease family)